MNRIIQNLIKVALSLTFLIITAINLQAAFLRDLPQTLKQPDGTILNCFTSGDEFHHWLHDVDGYTITINDQTGYFVYADIVNGKFTYTNLIPGIHIPSEHGLKPGYQLPSETIEEWTTIRKESIQKSVTYGGVPNTGNINNLVIFIRFADQEEFTESINEYHQMYNGKGQTNTLQNYFFQMSNWQLDIESHFFPHTTGIVQSYQDIHPRDYYCKYHELYNPIGFNTEGQLLSREQKLLERAIEHVDSQISNSGLNIDVNNDWVVDNVDFIIQGPRDYLDGGILWPHNWVLYSEWAFIGDWLDMRMVWSYNVQLSDFTFNGPGVGVLCHEMFHSVGAPDLYHYNYPWELLYPVGAWDIMAEDNRNSPQQMSAYMKYKYGKWFNYIPEITESGTYTLQPLSADPYACYKIKSPFSPHEFFILEYRKKDGLFDNNLPGVYDDGLVVYRINPNYEGNAQAIPGKDEIYVYRPDGTLNENGDLDDAAFSVSNGRTDFNDFTNPSCFLSNEGYGGLDISNVTVAGNTISFVVWGNNVNPPHNLQATSFGTNVNLFWTAPIIYNRVFVGYNIYRNGSKIATGVSEEHFTNYNVTMGTHEYKVTALYSDGESLPTNSVDISITTTTYSLPFIEEFVGHGLPSYWQNIDPNNNTQLWQFDNPGQRNIWGANFDDSFAILDSDLYGSGSEQKSYLVTPAINCSNSSAIELIFDQSFKSYPESHCSIELSENGVAWQTIYYNTVDMGYPNPAVKTSLDISQYAAFKPKIWLRFTYTGAWGWWWAIDNVVVRNMDEILDPPCQLEAIVIEDDVILSWYPPDYCNPQGEWINWDNGINDHGIGLLNGGSWFAAARWNNLNDFTGWYITKVAIFPRTDANTTFTLKVWKGANASTQVYSELLTNLVQYEWNHVVLDQAVQINSGEELWVGYKCTGQPAGDYPAGCDVGPAVAGYGDKISLNGTTWYNASALGNNYNWNIQVYVSPVSSKKPGTELITENLKMDELEQIPSLASQKSPDSKMAKLNKGRELLGFNIYRNYSLIATVNGINYTDSYLLPQNYVYTVKALYPQGESEMTTPAEVWVEYFQHHFAPSNAPPFNDMQILIYSAEHNTENLQFGDEIGAYDIDPVTGEEVCIATYAYLENNPKSGDSIWFTLPMNSSPPGNQINGYVEGNDFLFKFYLRDSGYVEPVAVKPHYPGYGNMTYTSNGFAYLDLSSVDTNYTVMEIPLKKGWQGLSSNLLPVDPTLLAILSDIEEDIILLADIEGLIYYPQRAGTEWDENKGYFIKVEEDCILSMVGTKMTDKTVVLHPGWNLIPVFSDCEFPTNQIIIQGNFEMIKEVAGVHLFWPMKQINTLESLKPGKAYLILMRSPGTLTFPDCD